MNVYLKNGSDQLPGDLILEWINRSDLSTAPRSLELTVLAKDGLQQRLVEGASLWTGRENLEYAIVKVDKPTPAGVVRGGEQLQALKVTALLRNFRGLAYRRERAVIADGQTIGACFRACGAEIAIGNDFPVRRFACYAGEVPSFHLARALQEECAALVLRDGRLSAERLPELFRQAPKDITGQNDPSHLIESEFLQRHEIPAAFSLDAMGNFVRGNFDAGRTVAFIPRTDERVLRNMTRVLVTRRILDSQLAEEIIAGDAVEVAGEKLVVMTAAHRMTHREGGAITSVSRFWLGSLSA